MESLPHFILGGTAEFILNEIETRNHIRFRVKVDSKDKNRYWVRYKPMGDWVYIGWIDISGELPVFHPLTLNVATPNEVIERADVFRKFILFIYYLKRIPRNLEVLYTGRCSVCGRTLKDPYYIKIGIGKICLENISER